MSVGELLRRFFVKGSGVESLAQFSSSMPFADSRRTCRFKTLWNNLHAHSVGVERGRPVISTKRKVNIRMAVVLNLTNVWL